MTTITYLTLAMILQPIAFGVYILHEQKKRHELEDEVKRERDNRIWNTNTLIHRIEKAEYSISALPTELGYKWEKGAEGKWVKK